MRRIAIALFVVLFAGTGFSSAQQQSKFEVFGGFTLTRAYGIPNYYGATSSNLTNGTYDTFQAVNLKGGGFAVTYYPSKHVGITGDFSFTGKNAPITTFITGRAMSEETHEYSYLFGPTFRTTLKGAGGRITLFAHQLFGVSHTAIDFTPSNGFDCYYDGTTGRSNCKATPFSMATGGGADIAVNSHISIRPVQLDYWTEQLKMKTFLGEGLFTTTDSAKLGAGGLRYSAGAVVRF